MPGQSGTFARGRCAGYASEAFAGECVAETDSGQRTALVLELGGMTTCRSLRDQLCPYIPGGSWVPGPQCGGSDGGSDGDGDSTDGDGSDAAAPAADAADNDEGEGGFCLSPNTFAGECVSETDSGQRTALVLELGGEATCRSLRDQLCPYIPGGSWSPSALCAGGAAAQGAPADRPWWQWWP